MKRQLETMPPSTPITEGNRNVIYILYLSLSLSLSLSLAMPLSSELFQSEPIESVDSESLMEAFTPELK